MKLPAKGMRRVQSPSEMCVLYTSSSTSLGFQKRCSEGALMATGDPVWARALGDHGGCSPRYSPPRCPSEGQPLCPASTFSCSGHWVVVWMAESTKAGGGTSLRPLPHGGGSHSTSYRPGTREPHTAVAYLSSAPTGLGKDLCVLVSPTKVSPCRAQAPGTTEDMQVVGPNPRLQPAH